MAKTYRMSRATRLINSLFRTLTRFGLGASYRHILTVPGRKTGRLYSTPVDVLELDGQRWLVSAYGPTSWVANARAAGEVTLSRGGRSEQFEVEELRRRPQSRCFATTSLRSASPAPTSTLARRQPTRKLRQNSRGTQSSVSSITHGGSRCLRLNRSEPRDGDAESDDLGGGKSCFGDALSGNAEDGVGRAAHSVREACDAVADQLCADNDEEYGHDRGIVASHPTSKSVQHAPRSIAERKCEK